MDFEIAEPYRCYARTKKQTNCAGVTYNVIDGDTPEEKLRTLLACNCCERHQINKPKTLEPWVECISNRHRGSWKIEITTECLCDCRHLARILCRPCD